MRDSHSKDHDKFSKLDDPPNSRLFVAQIKDISEEELREAFGHYGEVEDVWICKDKHTGEPKNIAFIKFTKTSDAARAMEGLNGQVLDGHSKPIKVTVALSRDQPNLMGKSDDMERLLRLFIVVPKSIGEDDINAEFKKYGDIDYISVIRDRETKESKGYAFVKYKKVSHAATAFEECNRSYKAVFARPKEQDFQKKSNHHDRYMDPFDRPYNSMQSNSFNSMQQPSPPPFMDMASHSRQGYPGPSTMDLINNYSGRLDTARLTALVSTQLSEDQVERLFDLVPGLKICRFVNESTNYNRTPLLRRVLLEYASPNAASYALEKLHGFEYPPGKKIVVKSEYDGSDGLLGGVSGKRDAMGLVAAKSAPEITQELATLTKALAEATNMIKLQVGGALAGASRMGPGQGSDNYDPSLCSVRLPPPQPLARVESKTVERLFIVGQPSMPSRNALWDVFGRFGDLVDVYIINGKNCGFVNYAKKESAERAMEMLHGADVCQMRLKVSLADPPKNDSRKRLKMDPGN
ncbi:RNA-binding protein 45-like [Macrosteles quadrilineatus]|uniref:RNA-binding protein 45-like n=1 Tax=Macrosteles quadrilineatus TaxID=74068 RepID=UPI0023E2B1F8|nr:RNA-binding protein 45-like [Macrosteles quadrilineatus]